MIVSSNAILKCRSDWIYSDVHWACIQVDAYEVKKQELMQENADLRALLRSMQVKEMWCFKFYSLFLYVIMHVTELDSYSYSLYSKL